MKITNIRLIIFGLFFSIFRFIIYPIEDYPDIVFIYNRLVERGNPLAEYFNLDALFDKSGCAGVRYSSIITDYIFGGGHYNCTSSFPFSFSYFYSFLLIAIFLILLLLFFYKLSKSLFPLEQKIYSRLLFNLILLPSTSYFLLMLHPDIIYSFLMISFILFSFFLSFKKKLMYIYPIYIGPLIYLINNFEDENQYLIFLLLLFSSLFSLFLSKLNFVKKFFNALAFQFDRFLNLNFKIFRKDVFYISIFISFIIFIILYLRIKLLFLFAFDTDAALIEDVTFIAQVYTNEDDYYVFSTIEKYPIFVRLFGTLQGLIISTTMGIKPSIFTTLAVFSSFILGFIRSYSYKNLIPLFIRIFGLVLFFSVLVIISIFPFFSYSKYWLFLSPFLALFMVFTPRLSIASLSLVYLELILKSSWISLP